jgi:glycosyltransferase involved in cell wall biosynthesis
MKILVIIPAYNEEATVADVVRRTRFYMPGADVLVINDGSTDGTHDAAKKSEAVVIDLPFNLGIGSSMQTGYLYAARNGYDIAVQVDGDGQHDPSYIDTLIQPIVNNKADMSIGSRYIDKTEYKASLTRRTGMLLFSHLIRLLSGKTVMDTTSGFRAVNRKIIYSFAKSYPSDYPEVDVLLKLIKRNFRILEIPVRMHPRQAGKSSITPLYSLYYMFKVCFSLILGNNSMRGRQEG